MGDHGTGRLDKLCCSWVPDKQECWPFGRGGPLAPLAREAGEAAGDSV
jgi:hypothetical protein